ncbi:MAG: glycosyltransferase family 2 protein [Myxococcota bacterium]
MYHGRHVSLVIPARNEAAMLGGVLQRVPAWVDRVVVADNGSTDGTAECALRQGAQVVHEPRPGYGAACARGVAYTLALGTEFVAFCDADGSDDPRELDRLLRPLLNGRAGLVVGCRPHARMPRHQSLGTRFVCALLSLGFSTPVSDLGPFRAIRADTLRALALRDRGFGWTAEMQARALRFGVPVREVPVGWRAGGGHSEITGTWRGVYRAGRDLLRHTLREILAAKRDAWHRGPGVSARAEWPGASYKM